MRTLFGRCAPAFGVAVIDVCLLTMAEGTVHAEEWSRLAINDAATRASVSAALDGVVRWWAHPTCRGVLSDFQDENGNRLAEKLAAFHSAFETYLHWIVFRDATGTATCSNPNRYAATAPGSRVVFVCGNAFRRLWARDTARGKAVIIHEVLHTLGLGENDSDDSVEITRTVLDRCERRSASSLVPNP